MVGCDDDGCEVEWYHDICLNQREKDMKAAGGRWVCQQCLDRSGHPGEEGVRQEQDGTQLDVRQGDDVHEVDLRKEQGFEEDGVREEQDGNEIEVRAGGRSRSVSTASESDDSTADSTYKYHQQLRILNHRVRALEELVAQGDVNAQDEINWITFRFHWRNAAERLTNMHTDATMLSTGLPKLCWFHGLQ
jgi:hypothetical protein